MKNAKPAIAKADLQARIDKLNRAPAKKMGKRAAALADPASLKRMQAAQKALDVLTEMGKRGEVKTCAVIRAIVGNFPLLRREAMLILTAAGFHGPTVNSNFQGVRSGKLAVPYLPKTLTQ